VVAQVQQPTAAQARSHYDAQQQIATAAVLRTRPMIRAKVPLTVVASTVAAYQLAAALAAVRTVAGWSKEAPQTSARAFAGWSSLGFPVVEPIIATIDARVPAPAEAVPAPWWDEASKFTHAVEQLIASEVRDAARSASQVEVAAQGWTSYVRILNLPSCKRCAVLAGRVYRWSTGFDRHPGCDCVMVPTDDHRDTNPLLTDPLEAIKTGQVRDLSAADYKAIVEDGADPTRVINARAGITAPGSYKATTTGVTKRTTWRKANPNKAFRLRPEGIYRWVDHNFAHLSEQKRREIAIEQLRNNGYLLPSAT
jgi:hypothetical protein